MTARLRPELADIPAYTPGKTVPGAIKLASNETVHGPLPSVREAIAAATETINRYPDNGQVELKEHLAAFLSRDGDFPPERVATAVWPPSPASCFTAGSRAPVPAARPARSRLTSWKNARPSA